MKQAAERLVDQDLAPALEAQQQTLDALEDIYIAVAPFPQFLATTTARQQMLVERSQQLVQSPEEQTDGDPDYEAVGHEQTVVRRRSEVLPLRAEQELKQLPPPVAGPAPPPTQSQPAEEPAAPAPPDFRPALEKAVELGPRIPPLTGQAAEDLKNAQPAAALPHQEQALALFRQIAELLPKQPPQDGASPDQQQPPPTDSQDQQPQPEADRSPSPGLSQQQAEALMRKVRERDRQYREKQQELQPFRRGAVVVEKDW